MDRKKNWVIRFLLVMVAVMGCWNPVFAQESGAFEADLTTWQKVLNVMKAPFIAIGALVYYPLKFIFYDIWVALYDWLVPPGSEDGSVSLEAMLSPDPAVRISALRGLSTAEDTDVHRLLRRACQDIDPSVRRVALRTLERLKLTSDLALVVRATRDPDDSVRGTAAHVLGAIGKPKHSKRLREMVEAPENKDRVYVQAALLRSLVRLDPEAARPLARKALGLRDSKNWVLVATAAHALGELGDRESRELLRSRVEDPVYYVRLASAESLARLGDQVWLLEQMEKGGDSDRVRALLLALGRHGRSLPMEALESRVGDSDARVAGAALRALAMQKSPRAIDHAIEWLDHANAFHRFYGYGLLTRLTGKDLGLESELWRRWWSTQRHSFRFSSTDAD
ncbi:MAG: HEAT repeat domain-containing protein [Planctomycetota bacterium]|nr:HEAT repeat domain-containing protein [Planctomycetota bacterium]